MSRRMYVLVVVVLMLTASIPALFTTSTTKGYPASPHYGNAYVGEFWIEEMNITIDSANSSGYDIAKMVKGHVTAQNDWIVYDANNSIVANYSIEIGNEHPWFNLTIYMEVYSIKSNISTFVGSVWHSIECYENRSCSTHGNISISLNEINFTENNLTLVCYLKAIIQSKIKINLNPPENLTYIAEDRSIVVVEESKNTHTQFSWYVDAVNKNLPSTWRYIPGIEFQPSEIQENWGNEQTFTLLMDMGYAAVYCDNHNESNTNESSNLTEKKVWIIEHLKLFSDLYNLWEDTNIPMRYRRVVKVLYYHIGDSYMTWNVSMSERKSGRVKGPVKVNFTVYPGALPIPVFVTWHMYGKHGSGGSTWLWYTFRGKEEYVQIGGEDAITVNIPSNITRSNRTVTWSLDFSGSVFANHRKVDSNTYTLQLRFLNESENNESSSNNTISDCYYPTWVGGVAYRLIANSTIGITSLTNGDITTVNIDIEDLVTDAEDIFIYTYGADSGSYRVDIHA